MTHPFTTADLIDCVEREIRMRERDYTRFVEQGKMKPSTAGLEIGMMQAVLQRLRTEQEAERLI